MNKEKRSLLKNDGVQSFIASIICILLGLLLLFNRGGTIAVISIVVGILLIVDGVMLIWDGTKKKSK